MLIGIEIGVRSVRIPGSVRCLVVVLDEERAILVTTGEVVEREIGDDVGGVALERTHLAVAVHLGVEVRPLTLKHFPLVETARPVGFGVAKVPLAEDRGLVAGGIQLLGDVGQAVVEVGPFVVTRLTWLYVPVSIAARLGSQMVLVQKQRSKRAPSSAIRSRFGVRLMRLP